MLPSILNCNIKNINLRAQFVLVEKITQRDGVYFTQLLNNLSAKDCITTLLSIDDTVFTDHQIKLLAYAICANTSLKRLAFNACYINNKQAGYIASALTYNSTINDLTLYNNEIGSDGAIEIAKILKSNKSIESFSFGRSSITDRGLLALGEAIQNSVSLRSIYITLRSEDLYSQEAKETLIKMVSQNEYILDYDAVVLNIPELKRLETGRQDIARAHLKGFKATQTKDILKRDFNVYYFWYIHHSIQNHLARPSEEEITRFYNITDLMFNCAMKFKFKLLSNIPVDYLTIGIWTSISKYFTFAEKLIEIGQYHKMYHYR